MTHSERCLDANRFGDGFDCICDEEPLPRASRRIEELTAEVDRLSKALEALTEENNGLVTDVAALLSYQRKAHEAIRSVALLIEADDKAGQQYWLRRGIVRIVRGEPRPAPCAECNVSGGHKLSCSQAPRPLRRLHAKMQAGTLRIAYGGRDTELEYLRGAIEKETDPDVRQRMQRRLEYVESKTDAELRQDFEPEEPE